MTPDPETRTPIARLEDVRVRYDRDHIERTTLELYDGWVRLEEGKWLPRESVRWIEED